MPGLRAERSGAPSVFFTAARRPALTTDLRMFGAAVAAGGLPGAWRHRGRTA
ncbi:hypothetical protein [Kitasatospora sp. NPDC057223]|uniref:hypothetical protein n=1 Tax=Kitasatospora sp. NPDC057223 TaxID=3346055 RepID=UPI0036370643